MSADVVAMLRAHLPRDRYDDDGDSIGTECTCGGWSGGYFADGEAGPFDDHLAAALKPLIADRVREAEQRGAVQALRDATQAWQWGEWTALTPAIKATEDNAQRIIGAAQSVTEWLRARADRLAGDER